MSRFGLHAVVAAAMMAARVALAGQPATLLIVTNSADDKGTSFVVNNIAPHLKWKFRSG